MTAPRILRNGRTQRKLPSQLRFLNRLTGRTYSDYNGPHPTPWVCYAYQNTTTDFVASVAAGSNSYTYSNYDALGRPGAGTQTVGSATYPFTNLAWTPQGQLASIQYPSQRVVTTSFDGAGRPTGVSGSLNGTNTNYASGVMYAAQGGPETLTTGDGLNRTIRAGHFSSSGVYTSR